MKTQTMCAGRGAATTLAASIVLSAVSHLVFAQDAAPLIEKVRIATAQYLDINAALQAKPHPYVTATPCVSGPDTGAMGVHLVRPDLIAQGALNADEPEALIYEPMADGSMRLVGVEFIILASTWTSINPAAGAVPNVDGNLMNYIEAPNRYGLPAFYELHVWAWEHNPKGSYADWNTHVTCEHQPDP
jgi:hypothetical protein